MLVLDSEQVALCLPMSEAISAMKAAFAAISDGSAIVPARGHLDVDTHHGTVLTMPSLVNSANSEVLSVKVATVFQKNHQRQLPTVMASVLALDPETGQPIAFVDGTSLTAIRTAAASAAASDLLARQESRTLAVIGAGVLARTHIRAFCQIRKIEKVLVYSRSADKCAVLCRELGDAVNGQLEVADTPEKAVHSADIICTVTNSPKPVFADEAVREGTHLVAVGSHDPTAAEIPAETVARSRIYVDQREPALRSGDLHQPISQGLLHKADIVGELGELILGEVNGRQTDREITLFKSVGNAAQDSFAIRVVIENARRNQIGTSIRF